MNRINKKLIISIFFLVVTIVLLCSTITLAWFTINVTDNIVVDIPADAVRMLEFDASTILDGGVLRPAVEKEGGIANNVDYSSIDLVNDSANLNKTATEVMIKAPLHVFVLPNDKTNGINVIIGLSVTLTNGDVEYEIIGQDVYEVLKFTFYKLENEEYTVATPTHLYEVMFYESGEIDVYAKVSLARPQGLLDPILADPNTELRVNINARMVLPNGDPVIQNVASNNVELKVMYNN